MEIVYGFALNTRVKRLYEESFLALLGTIKVAHFGLKHARRAGDLRAILRRNGTPIGNYDLLIAATALEGGLILVTSNTREFAQVPGLKTQDWRT